MHLLTAARGRRLPGIDSIFDVNSELEWDLVEIVTVHAGRRRHRTDPEAAVRKSILALLSKTQAVKPRV